MSAVEKFLAVCQSNDSSLIEKAIQAIDSAQERAACIIEGLESTNNAEFKIAYDTLLPQIKSALDMVLTTDKALAKKAFAHLSPQLAIDYLHEYVKDGYSNSAKALIDLGVTPTDDTLRLAVANGRTTIMEDLFRRDPNLSRKGLLHAACSSGYSEMLEKLLGMGVNDFHEVFEGKTPLQIIIQRGARDMMHKILDYAPQLLQFKFPNEGNLLDLAIKAQKPLLITYLKERGLTPSEKAPVVDATDDEVVVEVKPQASQDSGQDFMDSYPEVFEAFDAAFDRAYEKVMQNQQESNDAERAAHEEKLRKIKQESDARMASAQERIRKSQEKVEAILKNPRTQPSAQAPAATAPQESRPKTNATPPAPKQQPNTNTTPPPPTRVLQQEKPTATINLPIPHQTAVQGLVKNLNEFNDEHFGVINKRRSRTTVEKNIFLAAIVKKVSEIPDSQQWSTGQFLTHRVTLTAQDLPEKFRLLFKNGHALLGENLSIATVLNFQRRLGSHNMTASSLHFFKAGLTDKDKVKLTLLLALGRIRKEAGKVTDDASRVESLFKFGSSLSKKSGLFSALTAIDSKPDNTSLKDLLNIKLPSQVYNKRTKRYDDTEITVLDLLKKHRGKGLHLFGPQSQKDLTDLVGKSALHAATRS